MEKIIDTLTVIAIIVFLGIVVYVNIKCWSIPIAERSGICATLHQ